jgi:aspartate aminotransferase-like enzyme
LEQNYGVVVCPNGGEFRDKIFRVSHMGDMSLKYTDILINALFDYYKVKR